MATTRLRRTFAYPTESDSDDPPDLDEEHQEALLSTLQTQDEATSTLYRNLFLALPVLTSLAWLPTLFSASNVTETFVALISVVLPGIAAWVLWVYPITGETTGGVKPPVRYLIVFGASLAAVLVLQSGVMWWAVDSDVRATVPAGKSFSFFFFLFHSFIDVGYSPADVISAGQLYSSSCCLCGNSLHPWIWRS